MDYPYAERGYPIPPLGSAGQYAPAPHSRDELPSGRTPVHEVSPIGERRGSLVDVSHDAVPTPGSESSFLAIELLLSCPAPGGV